jgi:chaperonin GroES
MNIKPLDDRVVIEPLEKEEKTSGGIVLPDTAKEKQTRGRVVAVGPGKRLDDGTRAAVSLAVGDEVIFGKYSGSEFRVGEMEYTIMHAADVLAKVEVEAASEGKSKKK